MLAASDYIEFLVMPELSGINEKNAPGVDLHVKRTEVPFPVRSLENGSLDVVLGFESVLNPPIHLRRQYLFSDRMACVVRRQHPIVKRNPTLEEFVDIPHMLISRTGKDFGMIDQRLSELGLERRIKLIIPHFLSAALIVSKTEMILSLPHRIAEQFTTLAPLEVFPVPIELPDYNLCMVWHPLRDKDPAHQWLREQITLLCKDINIVQ